MSDPLLLHSTARCFASTRVRFALEEGGVPHRVVLHDDGWFLATYHRVGPMLEDGALALFEVNAILRHVARTRAPALWPGDPSAGAEADSWMDYSLTALRPALLRLMASPDEEARRGFVAVLGTLDSALSEREWLAGSLSVADLAYASLVQVPRLDELSADRPRLRAWLERLRGRPAWARATAAPASEERGAA